MGPRVFECSGLFSVFLGVNLKGVLGEGFGFGLPGVGL